MHSPVPCASGVLLACVSSSDHISSYLVLLGTRKKVKLRLRPGAFRVHHGSATSASFILCRSCPLSNLLFDLRDLFFVVARNHVVFCFLFFFPWDLRACNRAGWLKHLVLVCLLMTTVWHWHQFPGEAGPPKDFKDILVPSAASSVSIYLVPLLHAPFDQNDWFDP